MKVTIRDLFNYANPARTFKGFVKENLIKTEEMLDVMYLGNPPITVTIDEVLEAKRNGTLAGEQVQHERSQDEVDCG